MRSSTQPGHDRPPSIIGDHSDCCPHSCGKQALSSACALCPQNSGNLSENLETTCHYGKSRKKSSEPPPPGFPKWTVLLGACGAGELP